MKQTDTYQITPDPHQSSPAEEAKRLGITVEQLYAQTRKQSEAAIAELLALNPGKELTPREIEKTRKAMEKATEARAKEMRKAQRTSELPFPLPDIYDEDDSLLPHDAACAVRDYRLLLLRFGPDRDQDESQFKKATDVALDIRLAWSGEWNVELAEVPLAKDFKRPTDEDFARLEQWFLTAANAIKKEIARCEAAAAGRVSDARQGGTLAPTNLREWANSDSGMFAVVFTDIVASVKLRRQRGDSGMKTILKRHFGKAESLAKKYHGFMVKTTGDGVMAMFRRAPDALKFTLALEVSTRGHFLIRAGIHVGPVDIVPNDCSGTTVDFTQRVMNKAKKGGVFVSDRAMQDIKQIGDGPRNAGYEQMPGIRLKGFDDAQILWQAKRKPSHGKQ